MVVEARGAGYDAVGEQLARYEAEVYPGREDASEGYGADFGGVGGGDLGGVG